MKLKPANKEQKERFEQMKLLGCVCCRLDDLKTWVYPEIHHFTIANQRISHDYTAPLCKAHHTGDEKHHTGMYTLSWHKHRAKFRQAYGTDTELVDVTNQFLERM